MLLGLVERVVFGDTGEERDDDEKSIVGRTNDCDGSIRSIFISSPAPASPSTELKSLILSSSLPISEAEAESEEGVPESERTS